MGDDTQGQELADRPTLFLKIREWVQKAGAILARWWEQPIGIIVPFVALVILLLAPQSADMFTGMMGLGSAFGFAVAAAVLAFSSWYWTRAALVVLDKQANNYASYRAYRTARREKRHKLPVTKWSDEDWEQWSDEWAPRIGILFALIIAALPLIITTRPLISETIGTFLPFVSDTIGKVLPFIFLLFVALVVLLLLIELAPHRVAFGIAVVLAVIALVLLLLTILKVIDSFSLLASALGILAVYIVGLFTLPDTARLFFGWMERGFRRPIRRPIGAREEDSQYGDDDTRRKEEKSWRRWEFISVFAAARFGPTAALFFLALSVVGVIIVAFFPELVNRVDAPIAALGALALVIPLLVLALAVVRDVVLWVLTASIWVWDNRVQGKKSTWRSLRTACNQRDVRALTGSLGLFILAGIIFTPWLSSQSMGGLYEIRKAARLAKAEMPTDCPPVNNEQNTSAFLDQPRPTMREALEKWRQARLDAGHPPDKPMPAIIVAASGGASRAAFWLLSSMGMLDQKTEEAFGRYLFAISGVSGGSLGAVTYLQALRQYPRISEVNGKPNVVGVDWKEVNKRLEDFQKTDLLVASVSTYFLNDSIRPILQLVPGAKAALLPDRATALELAFERHWADADRLAIPEEQAKSGLIALWQGGGWAMPHLLLNGTDVASGRRIITSTIRFTNEDDLFAASDDLLTLLKYDVPASTAVTNSARFPFISPAGRFWTGAEEDLMPRQVIDGGYFENYGARTGAELADKVERISREMADEKGQPIAPIVPIVVVISNDAEALRSKDVEACKQVNMGKHSDDKVACLSLEEATVHCWTPDEANGKSEEATASCLPREQPTEEDQRAEEAQQVALARNPRGGGFGPEGLAPLLGLNATRGAHGQDALNSLRRRFCPAQAVQRNPRCGLAQGPLTGIESLPRMIHIALPRPKPEDGESAPLNWVLNENSVNFLRKAADPDVEKAGFDFNIKQAEILRDTLQALERDEFGLSRR